MTALRTAALAAALLAVAASPAAAAALHVHVRDFQFMPALTLAAAGDTVTWDNHDPEAHTATDLDCAAAGGPGPCAFDSGVVNPGGAFTATLAAPGDHDYLCILHDFFGHVVVNGAPDGPDLVLARLVAREETPGLSTRIDATVRNDGPVPAPATHLRVLYRYRETVREIGVADVPPLAPGAASDHSLAWDTSGKAGDFTLQARADGGNEVGEAREDNNRLFAVASVLLPGGALPGGLDVRERPF